MLTKKNVFKTCLIFLHSDQTTCDQVCFSVALHMSLFVVVTKQDICDSRQLEQTTQDIIHTLLEKNSMKHMIVQSSDDVHSAASAVKAGK